MKLRILFSIVFILFFSSICKAQVTIGSTNEPESFSALQLDGNNGGLRLPRLSQEQRNSLGVDVNSAGLIIYNETSKSIEYWDGYKWTITGDTIKIYNGIRKDGTTVKLGGELTKETTINLNNKNLEFTTGNSNTKGFNINDTVFVVNGRIVDIRPSKFTVNRSTLKIKDTDSQVSVDNVLKIKVKHDSTWVSNDSTHIHGQLYFDNNKSNLLDKVLISRTRGDAFWGTLKPLLEIGKTFLIGNIKRAGTGTNTVWIMNSSLNIGTSSGTVISDTLTLSPGKWLVFSKFSTKTNYSAQKMFTWSHIYKPGSTTPLATIGADVEDATSTSAPELTYLMDVDTSTNIFIVASSSNNQTWLIESDGTGSATTDFGIPYFFAIMIENYEED